MIGPPPACSRKECVHVTQVLAPCFAGTALSASLNASLPRGWAMEWHEDYFGEQSLVLMPLAADAAAPTIVIRPGAGHFDLDLLRDDRLHASGRFSDPAELRGIVARIMRAGTRLAS